MDQQETQRKSIFRKSALDRISSPEDLDQYRTVTGPGVWLPLLTVAVLLVGVIVWMIFGNIQVSMDVAVESSGGAVVCYVPTEYRGNALYSGTVTIAGEQYTLRDVGYAGQLVDYEMSVTIRRAGNLNVGDTVSPMLVDAELPQGVYAGQIVVDAVHPISYVIN